MFKVYVTFIVVHPLLFFIVSLCCRLSSMIFPGRTFRCCSHRMPLFIGCALGIALSLIIIPLIEEKCMRLPKHSLFLDNAELKTPESSEDYEPVLIFQGKPQSPPARFEKAPLTRPRYYSTELNIREKIFIAILSTPKTVRTLASSLNRTLQKHADKVIFFLEGADSHTQFNTAESSVVGFVDKRSVLTPFYMLQYIADNFINDYDFFFIARDTTHIRGHKLNEFVSRISVSFNVHVGQKIDSDSLYCSLDAGVILSNSVVRKAIVDLDWCIQHAFSDSSNNFGRCVLHGTNQPCVSTVQGLNFVSHSVSNYDSLEASILKASWLNDLKLAITLYFVTNPDDHYIIHHYFCQQELNDNQLLLHEYKDKIVSLGSVLPSGLNKMTWPIGIEPPFKARYRFDVVNWIYFNETHSFLPNEQTGNAELLGLHKVEIQDIIKHSVIWATSKYEDKCIFQKLVNGYKRFDPTRGTEYVLDLIFLEDNTGKQILKRIEAVRPLNEVEIVPVPFVTEHSRIVILLVIKASEKNAALRFLEDYGKICLEKQDSTVLLVVFLYGPQDPSKGENDIFDLLKKSINALTNKYRSTGAKIAWLSIRTAGKVPPMFAILDLVSRKLATDSLLLLCKVGMEIHLEYLNRVRMNTIIKTQVFFPIPYVQYHPSLAYKHVAPPDVVEVKKDFGHFDSHSYVHCSFYLSDFLSVRSQYLNKIPILKSEKDLKNDYQVNFDIYEMFLHSNLHIMRAVEPHLRLRFSFDLCDVDSHPHVYQTCLKHREIKLGSKSQLAAAVLSRSELDNDNVELNVDL